MYNRPPWLHDYKSSFEANNNITTILKQWKQQCHMHPHIHFLVIRVVHNHLVQTTFVACSSIMMGFMISHGCWTLAWCILMMHSIFVSQKDSIDLNWLLILPTLPFTSVYATDQHLHRSSSDLKDCEYFILKF